MKLAKIKQMLKQHPKDELLLFENYLHSSSTFSSKNKIYSKKQAKEQLVFMRN